MFDMNLLIKKAEILIEALPYIQRLSGKTVVIKYGGNAMINEELKDSVMEDITLLKFIGLNPVVVHGGGPDISSALKTYGIESKFINALNIASRVLLCLLSIKHHTFLYFCSVLNTPRVNVSPFLLF